MHKCTVYFSPQNRVATVAYGKTLLDAALEADIPVNAVCGGEGICGRCKMRVTQGNVDPVFHGKLDDDEIKKGYVLSCAARVKSDTAVEVPPDTVLRERKKDDFETGRFGEAHDADRSVERYGTSSLVYYIPMTLKEPTLDDHLSDFERLANAIKAKTGIAEIRAGLDIVRRIPDALRAEGFRVWAIVGRTESGAAILDIGPGEREGECHVAIVDVGTTTIVAHLVRIRDAKTIGVKACFNSQIAHGAEVTTRIIGSEKKGTGELAKLVRGDINSLIKELVAESGIDASDIHALVCAGNTIMMHFLLALPASGIRRSPYIPVVVDPGFMFARDAGLSIHHDGALYFIPGISGWVGGDLVAGVLHTGMTGRKHVSMLVDIGTNGEIAVGNSEWLIACSASAGPALEGASIACGIRAEEGAIDSVFIDNGAISYSTIGGGPAKGICGSGIIDLVAALFAMKIIDRNGRLVPNTNDRIERIRDSLCYVIAEPGATSIGKKIYMSEADIENVIAAKAAIFAAMKIALARVGTAFSDLDRLYIGGAFGSFINIESAITIGLLPNIPRERFEYAGNTSLKGAKLAAFSADGNERIERIRHMTTYYDLMGAPDYVDEFKKALFLPHTDIEDFRRQQ